MLYFLLTTVALSICLNLVGHNVWVQANDVRVRRGRWEDLFVGTTPRATTAYVLRVRPKTTATRSSTLPIDSTTPPSTDFVVVSTSTKIPATTSTQIPTTTSTQIPTTTSTKIPTTSTKIPTTSTKIPTTSTKIPTNSTIAPSKSTESPVNSTVVPPTETNITTSAGQQLTSLDNLFALWFNYTKGTIEEESVLTCQNKLEGSSFDDCAHLTTGVFYDKFNKITHEEIHRYIYDNVSLYADDEYEYYHAAPWKLSDPPMYSEVTEINGQTWYRRPLWAHEFHVHAEPDYPKKFPVEWVQFEDSRESDD